MRTPLVIAMGVIWSVVGGSLGLITPALAAVDYANLVDDRIITVRSAGDVAAKRDALVRFIWGNEGFPTGQPTVEPNVASPLPDLENWRP